MQNDMQNDHSEHTPAYEIEALIRNMAMMYLEQHICMSRISILQRIYFKMFLLK